MRSLFNQIAALTWLNIRSIPQRAAMSFASIAAVALCVMVLLFFLALANGLQRTVANSANDAVAVVLRKGANIELNSVVSRDQLAVLETGPGLRVLADRPVISGELLVIVDGLRRSTSTKANMPFRGLSAEGLNGRPGVRIVQGRMFQSGTSEIVVGAGLMREFSGFELGRTIRLRGLDWRVVGVFEAPGTVAESELWSDITVLQSHFDRANVYQTVRVQFVSADAVRAFRTWASAEPRLAGLEVLSERDYFARQASQSSVLFRLLAWALGVVMAIGALAGAINTMFASVVARAREIVTLRVIGFSAFATFVGTMAEALVLSALGGAIGVVLAMAAFSGRTTSTVSGLTQLVFRFELSPAIVGSAMVMAVLVGFVGGIFPGLQAARQRPHLEMAAP